MSLWGSFKRQVSLYVLICDLAYSNCSLSSKLMKYHALQNIKISEFDLCQLTLA